MIYAGRPDMYSDFLKFQSECKQNRERDARIAVLKRHATLKMIRQFITIVGIAAAVIPVIIYALIFLVNK